MRGASAELLERLEREVLVLDGAMGSMLIAAGLPAGSCPESWNKSRPEAVIAVHRAYVEAGCDIIETNTFGGTRLKLASHGLGEHARELNILGAHLARSACRPGGYVAGSIGPTGRLPDTLAPMGDVPPEEMSASFAEQALALAEGGVDLLAIETMMAPEEAVLAVRAAKEATGLPVMCTMSFQYTAARNTDRTLWGTTPQEAARLLCSEGAEIVGCNCGDGGPERAIEILRKMREETEAPLAAYPNAGTPRLVGDQTVYDMQPEEMAAAYPAIVEAGARIVGACCGSTPEHIRQIAAAVRRGRA